MKQFRLAMMGMVLLCGAVGVRAQTSELIVQRDAGGLFLNHQVAPKENFYSIGRLFNMNPKVIAPFNGLALNGGLSIGQVIKIPLKDQNFTAVRKVGGPEVLVPVYRLSDGKKVVAGYLKVLKGQSALASGGPVPAPAVVSAAPPRHDAASAPVTSPKATTAQTTAAAANADQSATNTATDPLAAPPTQVHVTVPSTTAATKKTHQPTPAPVVEAPAVTTTAPTSGGARYSGEGAFHPDYLTQTDEGRKTKSASGLAGVFKSTSGWDNGKFYALMNNVSRGTVVKVTNLANNRVVFVKVLGDIADIRQNTGMLIVLSDAAVSQLGAGTDRFTTELSFAK